MSKYRIYELAKEFSLDSKKIVDILKSNNFNVNNHLNLVGEKEREVIATTVNNKENKNTNTNTARKNNQHNNNQHNNRNNQHNNNQHKNANSNNAGNNANVAGQGKNNSAQNRNNNRRPNNNAEFKAKNTTVNANSSNSNANAGVNNNSKNNSGNNNRYKNHQNNRPQNNERFEKNDRFERAERSERAEKGNRAEQRGDKNMRNDRSERSNIKNSNKNSNKNKNNNQANNKFASKANNKPKNNRGKNNKQPVVESKPQEIIRPKHIKIGETITVKELASKMTYPVTDIIKKLMLLGTMATINQELDFETASLIAEEFNIAVEELPPEVDLTEIPEVEDDPKKLSLRPPVVTVMGHVDHGKTSLLDAIRKTSVTSNEAGGITQHIGAYQVMCNGQKIVFLDTPGHEAFTAMRARGAQVTDIAVLVVAADDGVMPQTLEAINHAKAAKVPIVVAINKMDKPGANPDHVKQQLAEHELIPEEWGGQTIMVPVSAKKKVGISDLLEMILLVAEVQELKANPNREARGVIIEARLDKGRGPVASVLVQNGTLHIGDFIIAGTACGKVRAMINDRGEKVKKAGPSMPVEVLGLADVPEAGDELASLDEKLAKTIAEKRIEKQRNELMRSKKVSLDDLFNQINEGDIKELNILIKADVQGSVEAISSSLLGLNKNESEVRVTIVHSGVGAVTESDVMLASAANALIIAFNVRPDANARKLADSEKIDIHTYRVIYEAIDDIQAAMKGMLAPKYKEVIQGKVEIRQVMKFSKALVAGSYVLEGKVCNNSKIRLIRDNIVLHEGQIESLRRFKDDVKEVATGYECGITIDNYRDFREGDILEVYDMEEIPQS